MNTDKMPLVPQDQFNSGVSTVGSGQLTPPNRRMEKSLSLELVMQTIAQYQPPSPNSQLPDGAS